MPESDRGTTLKFAEEVSDPLHAQLIILSMPNIEVAAEDFGPYRHSP